MNHEFQVSVESFQWSSEDQRVGYLALASYLREKTGAVPDKVDPVSAFLIQKAHDSNEYWRDLVATQVDDLQNQIHLLQEQVNAQAEMIDQIKITGKALVLALEKSGNKAEALESAEQE